MHKHYLYNKSRVCFCEDPTFEDKNGKFFVKLFRIMENFQEFEELYKGKYKTKDMVSWGIKT